MNDDDRHGPGPVDPGEATGSDELTYKLRLGDPAADAPQIDGLELARMRRTIIAAAEEAQDTRAGSWTWINVSRPLAVALATIVIALFAVWLFTPTPGIVPGGPAAGDDVPPGAVADAAPPTVEPAEAGSAPPPRTSTQAEPLSPEQTTTLPDPAIESPVPAEQISPIEQVAPPQTLEPQPIAPPDAPTAITVADTSPSDRQARTVQFTAPRGTRIIWTLDPNFESPFVEQTARQEQGK